MIFLGDRGATKFAVGDKSVEKIMLGDEQVYPNLVIDTSGWYTVTLNSDTYGDWDINELVYTGWYWLGLNPTNHTMDSSFELQSTGVYKTNDYFKTRVLDTTHFEADRNYADQGTNGTYRCKLTWDGTTRTWTRTDNDDYYIYPVNQAASNSHSLGVCTNDPRFLVFLYKTGVYNFSGIYDEYPKTGLIWLDKDQPLPGTNLV